jgi:hypothetical protein
MSLLALLVKLTGYIYYRLLLTKIPYMEEARYNDLWMASKS